jgi:hypothetical protein
MSTGRPAPRSGAVGCGCGCATFIVLLILVFVVEAIVYPTPPKPSLVPDSGSDYDSTYFQDHATLILVTTPGHTYTIHILNVNSSIKGYWAAPQGLQFVLDGSSGDSQVVLQPKAEDWGSVIYTSCLGSSNTSCGESVSFDVSCSLTVPSVPGPAEQTITGQITGTITYPEALGGSAFQDSDMMIDVPIKIKLLSPQHYAQLTEQINNQSQKEGGDIMLILFLSSIPIGLISWWVGRRYARNH